MTERELDALWATYEAYMRAVDGGSPGKFGAISRWKKIAAEKMPDVLRYVRRLQDKIAQLEGR